VNGEATYCRTF
jgi:hypothetical protein